MARRLDDPELIANSLMGVFFTLIGPGHTEPRLAIATEILKLGRAANSTQGLCDGVFWRANCLLELGMCLVLTQRSMRCAY
jgi:hypothetical protein